MASSSQADHHLHLGYLPQLQPSQPRSGSSTANTSPIEQPSGNGIRSPFGGGNGLGSSSSAAATTAAASTGRLGAGSPSHEMGGRLFSKRAREIQAQERMGPSLWGPPTSGNSTPLRENIPESPTATDGFPDFKPLPSENTTNSARRARAGTLPSRFSPGAPLGSTGTSSPSRQPKTSRPTPTGSPFKPESNNLGGGEGTESLTSIPTMSTPMLLARLRSGSMPQRNSYMGTTAQSGPFGPTLFSTNWANGGRERSSTLNSIGSGNTPLSPAQSSFSKEGVGDNEMRTLDYLGLADTPQSQRNSISRSTVDSILESQRLAMQQSFLPDLAGLNKANNRFRSYSVNAKEKYAEEEDEDLEHHDPYSAQHSGSITPSAASAAAALAATQAQIHQHNLAVQAFTNQASVSRPRARTAGVLESPPRRTMRNYLATPSRLDNSFTAADLHVDEDGNYTTLPEVMQNMQLNGLANSFANDASNQPFGESTLDGPTRALWLGSIPSSTTVSSINAIFSPFGKIDSARVLTHKNCGFVNFDSTEDAIKAKSLLNGKEIFPGAGPVRIGFAKVPDNLQSGTSGVNGIYDSSPESIPKEQNGAESTGVARSTDGYVDGQTSGEGAVPLTITDLRDAREDILSIVPEFGATEDDLTNISRTIDEALGFESFDSEIPSIPEPSQARIHDAPKLREIRKRIDNSSCSKAEIEETAIGMLPEIAELSSDYLGNTVVQKLFEHSSELVKESMLKEIAPHLAEIGVHKNGTWAAQKIIERAKTPGQQQLIVDCLRPFTVPLFLDQFGNYVVQGCLQFGAPGNNFIFEVMLSKMWDIAQGRFGARAMRACLESHQSTKDQQRLLAAAIAMHSVQLATNANGALLLTWFLDTCTFPRRRSVLAPRLVPHLVHLCTHKVAYLTVLKVINQRNEPEARDVVLRALFFSPNDKVLEEILSDSNCGATLIFKVLTTPFFEESMRADVVQNVRTVLTRLKAQPQQGYKRLMDEVGLATRNGGGGGAGGNQSREGSRPGTSRERGRSSSAHRTGSAANAAAASQPALVDGTNNFVSLGQQAATRFPAYAPQMVDGSGGALDAPVAVNGMFGPQAGLAGGMSLSPQQMQYQQAMLAASTRTVAPGGFYSAGMPQPAAAVQPMSPPSATTAFNPYMGQMMGFNYPAAAINGAGMGMPFMQHQHQHQQQPQQQPVRERRDRVGSYQGDGWQTY